MIINDIMISIKQASEKIGVHPQTLRKWEKEGKITPSYTPGGKRRYSSSEIEKFTNRKDGRSSYIYCRVSSRKQEGDLNRQVAHMSERFPDYEVITDIASGVHYRRPGIRKLLERILEGDVENIAIAYKDRLGRFGYDLIEYICKKSGTNIIVAFSENLSTQEELSDDIIAVVTSFAAQAHGKRKYANKSKKSKNESSVDSTESPEKVDVSIKEDVQLEPGSIEFSENTKEKANQVQFEKPS